MKENMNFQAKVVSPFMTSQSAQLQSCGVSVAHSTVQFKRNCDVSCGARLGRLDFCLYPQTLYSYHSKEPAERAAAIFLAIPKDMDPEKRPHTCHKESYVHREYDPTTLAVSYS